MSEYVSRSLVDMTPNRHHIYTHTHLQFNTLVFQAFLVLRETAITFSSQSSSLPARRTLTLPSIFHLHLKPPSSTFILPLMIFLFPSLRRNALSHISFHPSPFLPFTSLPRSASLSPVSHYSHSQTPVSCPLLLHISSSFPPLIVPWPTACPSLVC